MRQPGRSSAKPREGLKLIPAKPISTDTEIAMDERISCRKPLGNGVRIEAREGVIYTTLLIRLAAALAVNPNLEVADSVLHSGYELEAKRKWSH